MSDISLKEAGHILNWIDRNGFWNWNLLSTGCSSRTRGVGVFMKHEFTEGIDERLLVRIPKNNILSPKNSFIYNLVVDYSEQSENEEVDLGQGMFSLVLCFIYELSAGHGSPWFDYVNSIDPLKHLDCETIPINLWTDEEKRLLSLTECGRLGMLDNSDLLDFYVECVLFAKKISNLVPIPRVFDVELEHCQQNIKYFVQEHFKDKVIDFGRYSLAVISRAFSIDDFHGNALVPGADLFNHMTPVQRDTEDGCEIMVKENVEFICDSSNVCGICGEPDCDDHEDSESEEIMEDSETEIQDDAASSEQGQYRESLQEQPFEDNKASVKKEYIDMEYIKELDDSLCHENPEDNISINLDTDAYSIIQKENVSDKNEELFRQLTDDSRCCDIVLVNLFLEGDDRELFNSYGNKLANPYLLQKYGFVTSVHEPNINDTCCLSLQLCEYVKQLKDKSSSVEKKQLQEKLLWYNRTGVDIVNSLLAEMRSSNDTDTESKSDASYFSEDLDFQEPENWQTSLVIRYDGSITPQAYAFVRLLTLSYNQFQLRLQNCPEENLSTWIGKILLTFQEDQEMEKVFKELVRRRLLTYHRSNAMEASLPHRRILIENLIQQEQLVLEKALRSCICTNVAHTY